MSQLSELYQEMILDHNSHPRNFGKLERSSHRAEGYNPLCGDRISLYLRFNNDRLHEISFEGSGCAISRASASMMTAALKGKTEAEAANLFKKFHEMVTSPDVGKVRIDPCLGKLAVFSGVSEFPSRVKCATLAWHTFKSAVEGRREPVSTENNQARSAVEGEAPSGFAGGGGDASPYEKC